MITIIIIIVLLLIIFGHGNTIKKNFASLGEVEGMSYDDIYDVMGQPNRETMIGSTRVLRTWSSMSFSVSLLFDARTEKCIRVQSKSEI